MSNEWISEELFLVHQKINIKSIKKTLRTGHKDIKHVKHDSQWYKFSNGINICNKKKTKNEKREGKRTLERLSIVILAELKFHAPMHYMLFPSNKTSIKMSIMKIYDDSYRSLSLFLFAYIYVLRCLLNFYASIFMAHTMKECVENSTQKTHLLTYLLILCLWSKKILLLQTNTYVCSHSFAEENLKKTLTKWRRSRWSGGKEKER